MATGRREFAKGTCRRLQPGSDGSRRDDLRAEESALPDLPGDTVLPSAPERCPGAAACEDAEKGCAAIRPCGGSDRPAGQGVAGAASLAGIARGDVGIPEWTRRR